MTNRYEFREYCYRSDEGALTRGCGIFNTERNELAPLHQERDKAWQFLGELRNGLREWSTLGHWNQAAMDILELKHWRPGTTDHHKSPPAMPGKFGFMSGDE